jgi:hypothetical protein
MGTDEIQEDGWHHNERQFRWEGWSGGRLVCWFADEMVGRAPRSGPAREHLSRMGNKGRLLDDLLSHIDSLGAPEDV